MRLKSTLESWARTSLTPTYELDMEVT
jgi:hypothetical protein